MVVSFWEGLVNLIYLADVFNAHAYLGRTDWAAHSGMNGGPQYPGVRTTGTPQVYESYDIGRQRAMRILNPVPPIDTLPGAECFWEYLKSRYEGQPLTVLPYLVTDHSYGMEFAKRYEVMCGDVMIGYYATFGPKPGDQDYTREWHGAIPGYTSYAGHPEFIMVWSNQHFQEAHWPGQGRLLQTPWMRHDGHHTIPFP